MADVFPQDFRRRAPRGEILHISRQGADVSALVNVLCF